MKIQSLLAVLAGSVVAYSASATIVFFDDFSEADGTLIEGKAPDVGGNWDATHSAASYDIQSGSLDTAGEGARAVADFTATLGAGEVLTLTFDSLDPAAGDLFDSTWSGVSLFEGGSEKVFLGSPNNGSAAAMNWSVDNSLVPTTVNSTDDTVVTSVTFTYEYDSGDWDFSTTSGANLSGTGLSQLDISGLRVASGGGNGAIHVDNLSVDIRNVPEPGSLALLGLGGLALLYRRR